MKKYVYFFETPIRADLANAKKSIIQRQTLLQYFPEDRYKYIPRLENVYGEGGDGIHMNTEPAVVYTAHFKEQASRLMLEDQ